MSGLTYVAVGNERLVIEAEDSSDVIKIRMLNSQCPKRVVQPVVEVCDGDLHPPIVLVVDLHMPVDSNRAHVVRALQQRSTVLLRSVYSHRFKNFRVWPEKTYHVPHDDFYTTRYGTNTCYRSSNWSCFQSETYLTQLFLSWQPQAQWGQEVIVSL